MAEENSSPRAKHIAYPAVNSAQGIPTISRLSVENERQDDQTNETTVSMPSPGPSSPEQDNQSDVHVTRTSAEHLAPPSPNTQSVESRKPSLNSDLQTMSPSAFSRLKTKLGLMAILTFFVGTAVIVATMAFITFLWFSGNGNATWHWIVAHNRLIKLVTGLAEGLKQAITIQIGVMTAMLAALALENFQVALEDVAAVSMMRAQGGSGSLPVLLWKQIKGRMKRGLRNAHWVILMTLTACILALFQTVTIVLSSDIGLTPFPGFSSSQATPFGFRYVRPINSTVPTTQVLDRGTTWQKKPPFYPTFAEYSEPPYYASGVDDTGMTLRAFLPFQSEQIRQNIHSYNGRTTVIDTRVTCQVPHLENEGVSTVDDVTLVLQGRVSASRRTPRLDNSTLTVAFNSGGQYAPIHNQSMHFSCIASDSNSGITGAGIEATQWRTTLCQLGEGGNNLSAWSGGLVSEFQPLAPINFSSPQVEDSQNWGVAYLVLNVTNGTWNQWAGATGEVLGSPQTPPLYDERGAWLDLAFANGNLILSVSLCYASFLTADIPVRISSATNRTEPIPAYDFATSKYTYPTVRKLLGQDHTLTPAGRGILELAHQRDSWLANSSELTPVEPYIRDFANMGGPQGDGNSGNYSASLWDGQGPSSITDLPYMSLFTPDPSLWWLFQEIVTNGGSVAFAIQSLYTVLAGIAYYDQLGQFDNIGLVESSDFVTVNAPLHWRGWLATVIALFVHAVLASVVIVLYLQQCKCTTLGESWQALSQSVTSVTEDIIHMAPAMDDSEIKEKLGKKGRNVRVGIRHLADTGKPGVVDSNYEKSNRKEPKSDVMETSQLMNESSNGVGSAA